MENKFCLKSRKELDEIRKQKAEAKKQVNEISDETVYNAVAKAQDKAMKSLRKDPDKRNFLRDAEKLNNIYNAGLRREWRKKGLKNPVGMSAKQLGKVWDKDYEPVKDEYEKQLKKRNKIDAFGNEKNESLTANDWREKLDGDEFVTLKDGREGTLGGLVYDKDNNFVGYEFSTNPYGGYEYEEIKPEDIASLAESLTAKKALIKSKTILEEYEEYNESLSKADKRLVVPNKPRLKSLADDIVDLGVETAKSVGHALTGDIFRKRRKPVASEARLKELANKSKTGMKNKNFTASEALELSKKHLEERKTRSHRRKTMVAKSKIDENKKWDSFAGHSLPNGDRDDYEKTTKKELKSIVIPFSFKNPDQHSPADRINHKLVIKQEQDGTFSWSETSNDESGKGFKSAKEAFDNAVSTGEFPLEDYDGFQLDAKVDLATFFNESKISRSAQKKKSKISEKIQGNNLNSKWVIRAWMDNMNSEDGYDEIEFTKIGLIDFINSEEEDYYGDSYDYQAEPVEYDITDEELKTAINDNVFAWVFGDTASVVSIDGKPVNESMFNKYGEEVDPKEWENKEARGLNEAKSNEVNIFLTNLGKYNEGELVGEWVKLPVDDFQPILDRIGINDEYEEWFITDYEAPFEINEYDDIEELNDIAREIQDFNSIQLEVLDAYQDNGYDMRDAIDKVIENDYFYLEGDTEEDLAYSYIDMVGSFEDAVSKEDKQYYFDYEAYGRDLVLGGDYSYVDDVVDLNSFADKDTAITIFGDYGEDLPSEDDIAKYKKWIEIYNNYTDEQEEELAKQGIEVSTYSIYVDGVAYDVETLEQVVGEDYEVQSGYKDDDGNIVNVISEKELAEYVVDDLLGGLDQMSEDELERYFDYAWWGRTLAFDFYKIDNGWVRLD